MRANREAAEAKSIGTASSAELARRRTENEEWTWMVDEDPVFYLNESGTTVSGGSE